VPNLRHLLRSLAMCILVLASFDVSAKSRSFSLSDPDDGQERKESYSYSADGEMVQVTTPVGDVLSFGYDGPLLTSETWSGRIPIQGYHSESEPVAGAIKATLGAFMARKRDDADWINDRIAR